MIENKKGRYWVGKGIYDNKPWRSKRPLPVAQNISDFTQCKKAWNCYFERETLDKSSPSSSNRYFRRRFKTT